MLTPKRPAPTGPLKHNINFNIANYPPIGSIPSVNHPAVQAAIREIDWDFVPKLRPRRQDEAAKLDPDRDDGCWWTSTLCTTPKVKYLPADVTYCKNVKDFGLVKKIEELQV
jgi:hypothetical protein